MSDCQYGGVQNAVFGFWKQDLIPGMKQYIKEKEVMGSWGRIASLKGIPPDKGIIEFVKVAVKLNEQGIKSPKRAPKPVKFEMPADFMAAIKANKKALATYDAFSPVTKGTMLCGSMMPNPMKHVCGE